VSTPTTKRKRPGWVSWIPAGVLGLGTIAVIAASGILISQGLGSPAPKPTTGQVTDLNWSIFTPEGRGYIDTSREVRIDMSKPPIDAAALGLEPDGTLVIGPYDNGDLRLDVYLIVNGGGEGPGGAKFTMSEVRVETLDGEVVSVGGPLSLIYNFRQTLDQLLDRAETFGWDTSGVDDIYQTVEDATRAGEGYSFTFGPADRVGVNIAATATCDPSGYCLVEYEATPAVR
jgi:hypothetical protein